MNTLKKIFRYVCIIPGDKIYFICSQSNSQMSFDPDEIIKRYNDRKISSDFFEANYYYEILNKNKLNDFKEKINDSQIKIINKDSRPVSYFYNTYLFSNFDYTENPVFQNFLINPYSIYLIFSFFIIIFLIIFFTKKNKLENLILTSSFSSTSLILLILFSYQNITGRLYSDFSLFTGLFMLGSFFGNYFTSKAYLKNKYIPVILTVFNSLVILIAGLITCHTLIIDIAFITYSILFILMIISGIVAGINFSYCINKNSDSKESLLSNLCRFSMIYAFTASITSILWSISILPVLGNGLLTALLFLINVISMIFLLKK